MVDTGTQVEPHCSGIKNAVKDVNDGALMAMQEALIAVAWRITGDRSLAEDVVQDVYCAYYGAPEKFTGKSKLSTYLYRMTINRSIDMCRRRKRFMGIGELLLREPRPESGDVYEVKEMVRHLLSDISPVYKVPFVLAEGEGMAYEEIAVVLNITLNTVRSRIFRCREKMRKKLVAAGYSL